jgi:DNA-binding response OmpR family regulator
MVGHSDFKPDLIILDLDIPRVSGTALLEVWGPTHAPVVVFSSSLNERPRVLQLGAREFVPKPADFQAFTDAVREIVRKWAVPKAYGSAV